MPDTRQHRGPGPEDRHLFGPDAWKPLRSAVADLAWLRTRGYAEPSALKLVGDRYRLVERQRVAVLRSSCSNEAKERRIASQVEVAALRGKPIRIDGFNLILTLESALGGGVVLGGRDAVYRDLASVHGTYRRVEETQPALDLAAQWLHHWGIGPCAWLLDAPVSNSGRLAALIRATDPGWTAIVVPDPDPVLAQPGNVVATADSAILDRAEGWVNLARSLIEVGVPGAFVIDLGSG